MNSRSNAQSGRHSLAPFLARAGKVALLPIIVVFSAIVVPGVSAQTLLLQFPFNEVGTNAVDSVSGVSLGIYNAGGVLTDLHGGPGTGPAGLGNSLDFASATAGNGNNPVAYTLTNSTVNFGTIGAFTVTMWIKPTGAINFARFFGLGAIPAQDNGAANSLSFEGNANNVGVQCNVNTPNTTFASGLSLPQNSWTFIAYTYDGSSTIQVYTANTTPMWAGQRSLAPTPAGMSV